MAEVISSHRTLLMGLLADQPLATTDLRWIEVTGSTNAVLLAQLDSGDAAAWSIRIASKQTSGRGRQGRSWESPIGSVPISVAVPLAQFKPSPSWLSLITATSLKSALAKYLTEPILIKWPNDCLISTGKFAGILIERNQDYAVIGIGINFFAAPKIAAATNLNLTEYLPPLAEVIKTLIREIQSFAVMPDQAVREQVMTQVSTIGQVVEVQLVTGEKLNGTAISITDSGALMVQTQTGQIEVLTGDVIHLRPADAS